jgi:[acyl-carrier-protein] S-malonyltransferase
MSSKHVYILCPGQGAQSIGMGKDICQSSPAAKAVFDQANELLGFNLAEICFTGPQARLDQTDVSQPALYVTGIASFRAAVEVGAIDAAAVTAYAGLSLGEYTALHLAGAVSFEDGLRLVSRRGKFMQEAAVAKPSGMVAIIGGDEAKVAMLCEESAAGQILVAANFNAPGQIVVSGDKEACERVAKAAEAAGLRSAVLAVAGAFHSPLMQTAADRMKDELAGAKIARPAKPVYSNVTAQVHGEPDSIRHLLIDQIVQPVRWAQIMAVLVPEPEARFIELAPGRTLAGLAKRINRRLVVEENAGYNPQSRGVSPRADSVTAR